MREMLFSSMQKKFEITSTSINSIPKHHLQVLLDSSQYALEEVVGRCPSIVRCTKIYNIDYAETFVRVKKMKVVRILLSLTIYYEYIMHDVNNTFLCKPRRDDLYRHSTIDHE